jgi:protein TonB
MKPDSKTSLLPFVFSLILHAILASWLFVPWERSVDTLWSGGKSGGSGTIFVTVSAPPAGAKPANESQDMTRIMTRDSASKTKAPAATPRQKKALASPSPAQGPSRAKSGNGRGNSPVAAGGTRNGADATGTVSENAPNVLAAIRAKIIAKQKYPAAARRNGEKGTVKIGFKIASDGGVQNLRVLASSGHDALDDAAVTAVRAAVPLPYFPQTISLSLEYRLK